MTEKKDKVLQTRYTEGDDFYQTLLDTAKKEHLRTSRGFNLPEANRRTVIRSARLEQKIKELEAYQEWIENEVLSLPSAKVNFC